MIEKAKRQADDWETEEAAVTFSIPLVSGLVEEVEKLRSALAGLVGAENDDELRTMEAVIVLATVPDASKVSMPETQSMHD